MKEIRDSLDENRFLEYKKEFLERYEKNIKK
jgi:queuine/archaeosine tRNA-ribosyltransferase